HTRRMEQESRLLIEEGEWPLSAANDIVTQTTFGTLKAALAMEYKTAYEAAHQAGHSKAQAASVVEPDAFTRVTAFARSRSLLEPEAALREILPEGSLRVRVLAIDWKPLRGIKQESMLDPASVTARIDCSGQPVVELASFLELARAKAAYEAGVIQFGQDVDSE